MTLSDHDTTITEAISRATGRMFRPQQHIAATGGCINRAYTLSDGSQKFFVKLNDADKLSMFEAEADGLNAILASNSLRAPQPICRGIAGDNAFLVLEHLALGSHGDGAAMGLQLAMLHRNTAEQFGWQRDNTIGATLQPNLWTDNWIAFLREHRLGFQLRLARQNGLGSKLQIQGEKLLEHLNDFSPACQPVPSLLHGDLWGGNAAFTPGGEPVIFDPAVYYGDREADLAMTELFGGFGADFYAAYNEAWALDAGYRVRKTLYNLYHILNHANLFGGGYARQAEHMMDTLLAEIG
jgi:protein-ribulosamine 3-kinase